MSFSGWFQQQQASRSTSSGASGAAGGGAAQGGGWLARFSPAPAVPASEMAEPVAEGEGESLLPTFMRRSRPQPQPQSAVASMFTLSRGDRIKFFAALLGIAGLFFVLSLFVGLPVILLAPSKFALSFTMGSLFFMAAFMVLEGPVAHCRRCFSRDRIVFSALYVVSLVATLYACLSLHSYIITIAAATLQLTALAWFGASFIPGGTAGMRFMSSMLFSGVSRLWRS